MKKLLALLLLTLTVASAAELHVKDSSTWKQVTEVHVKDGSDWKEVREIHVNDGGTWKLVFNSALLETTITSGNDAENIGYLSGSYGSITNDTTTDGKTVTQWVDVFSANPLILSMVTVSGFVGDPGQSWASSFEVDGVVLLSGDASYSFFDGVATWTWDEQFGLQIGVPLSVVIR